MIIDFDSHVYETRDLWVRYADPADRDRAIRIVDDPLGYPLMQYKGQSPLGSFCWITEPGVRTKDGGIDATQYIGEPQRRQRDGLPAQQHYDDLDPAYTDMRVRRDRLAGWGIDETIVYPNWGLEFEGLFFNDDLPGLRINLAAWNRYAMDVVVEGQGKVHPAGHVSLQGDQQWVVDQLQALGKAGVRLAMFTPGLINGKRMSHPGNDPIWAAFAENELTLVNHVIVGVPYCIPRGWIDNDSAPFSILAQSWVNLPVQLALNDFVFNGVFDRFPTLRVAVVELGASAWVPKWLPGLDDLYVVHRTGQGWNLHDLAMRPSDYIRRHVRFALLPDEDAGGVISSCGNLFGFGGDWPHIEGVADPLRDFQKRNGIPEDTIAAELFYGGNAAWALHRRPL